MDMFIRVFYNGRIKDISLHDIQHYSIGSNTKDGFSIPGSDLQPEHIRFEKNKDGWFAVCTGEVFLSGHPVQTTQLSPSQIYVLSIKNRISALVIHEYLNPCEVISLANITELKIGRNDNNHIIVRSDIVSGSQASIKKIGSEIRLYDNHSTNGTYINGKAVSDHVLKDGDEIIVGDCKLLYQNNQLSIYGQDIVVNIDGEKKASENKTNMIIFKRSPRLKLDVPTGEIEIQSPPSIGSKPEVNWLSVLLPSLGTVSISAVVTVLTGMNPTMLAFTAPMAIIGVIVSIVNYFKQTKKHTRQEQLRLNKYTEHLNNVVAQIESKQEKQREALISANPDTVECISIVKKIDRRLWERRPSDNDFMNVRIGRGQMNFSMTIKIPRTTLSLTEDNLLNKANEIYDKYCQVDNLPITCSILNWSSCGIVGERKSSLRLVKNMLVQVATHHCYTEVKTVFVFDEKESKDMAWISGLPHAYDDEKKGCYIARNKKEVESLFAQFESLFKERERENEENHYEQTLKIPYYLFVISSPKLIKDETFRKYLYRNDRYLGLGAIFLYDSIDTLPKECKIIIEVNNDEGVIYNTELASKKQKFTFDNVEDKEFDELGSVIKNIYCDEMNTEESIVKNISLFEVLNIKSVTDLDIENRWNKSNVTKCISAPLGVKEKNEIVYLDLHENAHGPHGLVAGATGYGKSEVIQSYLLALATLYPPYEVGFVIIDFKGKGILEQLETLPHLIGSISDLDGKEIERSKLSIRAELDKRKRLFAENSVNKIDDYIELYKQHKVDTPLPHIIILVDEFAELRAQQPEFLDDLTSTARIGRSLGVHLILATQNPSGQVNDQIQSNTKFAICLHVKERTESEQVIKSPLAEKIKEKGRAYLRIFEGNTLELFQSGFGGIKTTLNDGTSVTQSKAIVNYIKEYCEKRGIPSLPSICLPSLSDSISYNGNLVLHNINGTKIPVGIYDYPSCQEQGPAYIDVGQNTFIIGSAQTGKTNLLQNLIRTLATVYTPNEINIYIIDFGSMTLKTFENLNHVGGVVIPEEDEKLKNLFKLLTTEIERRKRRTIEVGVSSFEAYVEGGYKDMPRIVLLLDNLVVYKELYGEEYDATFTHICRDGLTYGISIIVTSTQTSGFGYKYLSSFSDRIAFTCNDTGEYGNVFSGCRTQPSNLPGRALYKNIESVVEMQAFLAFEGKKEIERSTAMRKFIEETNKKYVGLYAKKIPCIPEKLTSSYIEENYDYQASRYEYVLGLDYASVDVVTLDFNTINEFAIVGKSVERKQRAAYYIMDALNDHVIEAPVKVYILDAIGRPLKKYSELSFVEKYTIDYNEIGTILDDVESMVVERYEVLVNDSIESLSQYPVIMVLINNSDVVEFMSTTKDVIEKYRSISKQMKALKVTFVFSDIDNANVSFGAPEILKKLKETKNALITDDLKDVQFYDIAPAIVRSQKSLQTDDMFYMQDGEIKRIKIIKED